MATSLTWILSLYPKDSSFSRITWMHCAPMAGEKISFDLCQTSNEKLSATEGPMNSVINYVGSRVRCLARTKDTIFRRTLDCYSSNVAWKTIVSFYPRNFSSESLPSPVLFSVLQKISFRSSRIYLVRILGSLDWVSLHFLSSTCTQKSLMLKRGMGFLSGCALDTATPFPIEAYARESWFQSIVYNLSLSLNDCSDFSSSTEINPDVLGSWKNEP